MLDEMERDLIPGSKKSDVERTPQTRLGVAVGIFNLFIGVVGLVAGVMFKTPLLGVLGFAIIFSGALIVSGSPSNIRLGRKTYK